jgi:lipopolysaccharide/colanic/teichoic acid biosynthesis glycosyltransferase
MTDLLRTLPVGAVDHTYPDVEVLRVRAGLVAKRTLDVLLSAIALLLFAPLMLLIALAVRLDSSGPSLFRQTRVGAAGRRFNILKFRTMVPNAQEILEADADLYVRYMNNDFKLPTEIDPRVTRLGRFLRGSSLDELPQLWNILRGDMSLVGARPIEPAQVPMLYRGNSSLLLQMRPGLTGYWQVNGRSHVGDSERAELDLHYVRNWSLWLDLRILAKTVPAVLTRHGAH